MTGPRRWFRFDPGLVQLRTTVTTVVGVVPNRGPVDEGSPVGHTGNITRNVTAGTGRIVSSRS
jgi:hypothetical protein